MFECINRVFYFQRSKRSPYNYINICNTHSVHTYMHTHKHMYICIHSYIHIYVYIHTYIHTYRHIYIHACIHTYICIIMYMHIYTYIITPLICERSVLLSIHLMQRTFQIQWCSSSRLHDAGVQVTTAGLGFFLHSITKVWVKLVVLTFCLQAYSLPIVR